MSNQRSRVDEEDDLDDLDDVIDQFAAPAPQTVVPPAEAAASTSASASTPARPTQPEQDVLPDELAAEFAKGMQSLLDELTRDGATPGAGSSGADGTADPDLEVDGPWMHDRLAAAWEAMLVEGMNADPSASKSAGADYSSRIRSTVDRRRERESELHPSTSGTNPGTQGENELEVLEMIMRHIMSKEVLYEPLKELHEKFPGYLAEHAATILPQDKARYEAQIQCIKRLIGEFEANSYRDDDESSRERIVEIMGELQTHGQPPEEIMGPLPPGFSMGTDGLPDCNVN